MWGELRQKQATLTIRAGSPMALRKLGVVSEHVALLLTPVATSWPFPGLQNWQWEQTCLAWQRSL